MTSEERQRTIRRLAEFPSRLETVLNETHPDRLDEPYREGGWTIRQVVHHLVDSHINGFIRMRTAVVSPNTDVMGYDQDGWSELADNREMPVEISVDLLHALHGRWAYMLDAVDEPHWQNTVIHSENGEESLEFMLAEYARHGEHHLAQITGHLARPK